MLHFDYFSLYSISYETAITLGRTSMLNSFGYDFSTFLELASLGETLETSKLLEWSNKLKNNANLERALVSLIKKGVVADNRKKNSNSITATTINTDFGLNMFSWSSEKVHTIDIPSVKNEALSATFQRVSDGMKKLLHYIEKFDVILSETHFSRQTYKYKVPLGLTHNLHKSLFEIKKIMAAWCDAHAIQYSRNQDLSHFENIENYTSYKTALKYFKNEIIQEEKNAKPLNLSQIAQSRNAMTILIHAKHSFSKENYSGLYFEDIDFSSVDLSECDFSKSIFKNCIFIGANLKNANFSNAEFEDCNFNGNFYTTVISKDFFIKCIKKYEKLTFELASGPFSFANMNIANSTGLSQGSYDFLIKNGAKGIPKIIENCISAFHFQQKLNGQDESDTARQIFKIENYPTISKTNSIEFSPPIISFVNNNNNQDNYYTPRLNPIIVKKEKRDFSSKQAINDFSKPVYLDSYKIKTWVMQVQNDNNIQVALLSLGRSVKNTDIEQIKTNSSLTKPKKKEENIEKNFTTITTNITCSSDVEVSISESVNSHLINIPFIKNEKLKDTFRRVSEGMVRFMTYVNQFKTFLNPALTNYNIHPNLIDVNFAASLISNKNQEEIKTIMFVWIQLQMIRQPDDFERVIFENKKLKTIHEKALRYFNKNLAMRENIFQKNNAVAAGNAFTILNYAKVKLAGKNFHGVCIDGADFSNADLSHCDFSYAILKRCLFVNANLNKATFTHTVLEDCNFFGDFQTTFVSKNAFIKFSKQYPALESNKSASSLNVTDLNISNTIGLSEETYHFLQSNGAIGVPKILENCTSAYKIRLSLSSGYKFNSIEDGWPQYLDYDSEPLELEHQTNNDIHEKPISIVPSLNLIQDSPNNSNNLMKNFIKPNEQAPQISLQDKISLPSSLFFTPRTAPSIKIPQEPLPTRSTLPLKSLEINPSKVPQSLFSDSKKSQISQPEISEIKEPEKNPELENIEIKIPKQYRCPISFELMEDPVMTALGQTYDRKNIENWLKTHDTDPLSNDVLPNKILTTNYFAKKAISSWQEKQKETTKSFSIN